MEEQTTRVKYKKEQESDDDQVKCTSPLCRSFDPHGHPHDHAHVKGDHEHSHSHSHSHGHDHGDMSFSGSDSEESRLLSLLPLFFGVGAIVTGFVLSRGGYASFRIFFLLAMVISGYPVLKAGVFELFHGNGANIELLTSIAAVGAIALGDWAEGALVMTLFGLGEYLEEMAGERSRRSIRNVLDLSPKKARVRREGKEAEEILAQDIIPGDHVLIFPGERISADGRVIEGESSCDESAITGESLPKDKAPGDQVFAGSLNGEGALTVLAERKGTDTTLSRIVSMVEEAQQSRAKSQRLVDQFAKVWTPAMIALGIIVSLVIPALTRQPFRIWMYRGLTLLIVACPCSLVISTPVTVVAAITRAARNGILIKGGIHLENLGRLKAMAFDKTGTLTSGKIKVADVLAADGTETRDVLRLAASLESLSEHPLARAIVEEASSLGLPLKTVEDFISLRGKGTRGILEGRQILTGSLKLFIEKHWDVPEELRQEANVFMDQGKTVVFVGDSGRAIGLLALSDEMDKEAASSLEELSRMGIHLTMLTGDDEKTANYVGRKLKISSIRAGLLPQEKLDEIKRLKEKYTYVGMIGDGVNDAPSLAAATVGVAVAEGADVALETSDVALMSRDLTKIPWSLRLSRKASGLIVQNVAFSIGLKALALVLVFEGILPLWVAVLADSGAAVIVTLNGLRILRYR